MDVFEANSSIENRNVSFYNLTRTFVEQFAKLDMLKKCTIK